MPSTVKGFNVAGQQEPVKYDYKFLDNNTDIAPEYSDSNAYAVGDYCHKNGQLYKCNTEIASPGESWNSSHWNIVNIAEELGHVDEELLERCPVAPSEDGTYVLKSVVSSGVKTYSWVAET